MAKSVADIEAQGTDTATDTGERESDKSEKTNLADLDPNETVQVMVTMPAGLKLKALERADAKDYTLARYVRELVASELEYDLPDTIRTRSKKYATEEDRIAAQKAKSAKRNALIKMLLSKYKDGEIDLDLDDDDDDDE